MELIPHPFNDKFGLQSIKNNTKTLFLGSFPAHQVTSKNNPRLDFYYGSDDSEFWDLIKKTFAIEIPITIGNMLDLLSENGIGILDIIRKCYRRDGTSSSDEDLSIIEFQDMIDVLCNTEIGTIYSTSNFVTTLLKNQLKPLLNAKIDGRNKKVKQIFISQTNEDFNYFSVYLPGHIFSIERTLKIITLFSPSDQGLRGLQKGINSKNLYCTATEYRERQYKHFLNP